MVRWEYQKSGVCTALIDEAQRTEFRVSLCTALAALSQVKNSSHWARSPDFTTTGYGYLEPQSPALCTLNLPVH